MNARQCILWGYSGLIVLTWLLYSPSLKGHFVYDDQWAIVRNPALTQSSLWRFWTDPSTGADPASGLTQDVYRPLTVSSFALSARLWGPHARGWRWENLCWHLLNGVLCGLLFYRLGWRHPFTLIFLGGVFLLHPLQVSAVAWIYQRATLISAAGCLLALLLFLSSESRKNFKLMGGLAALAAALCAKESAVVFPLLLAVLPVDAAQRTRKRIWFLSSSLLVLVFLAWRTHVLHGWSQIADLPRSVTEKAVLTSMAFPQYLAKFILPMKLRASYDLPVLSPSRVTFAGIGLLLSGVILFFILRRTTQGWRWALWFLCALLPMLPWAPIRAYFAERFVYVALIGLAALGGLTLERYPRWRPFAVIWLMGLSLMTRVYSQAWISEEHLWSWTVHQEPTNTFAHMCLAGAITDPVKAKAEYMEALAHHPSAEMTLTAWNNLSVIALAQHQDTEALYWADQVLKRRPTHPQALYNRWRALKAHGDRQQAQALRRTLLQNPQIPHELLQDDQQI